MHTSAEVLSLDVVRAACTPLEAPKAGSPLSLTGDVLRGRLDPAAEGPSAVLADASAACLQQARCESRLSWPARPALDGTMPQGGPSVLLSGIMEACLEYSFQ